MKTEFLCFLLFFLLSSLLSIDESFAQEEQDFPRIARLERAAQRISQGTVPAIRNMFKEGGSLFAQARKEGDLQLALMARKLFEKAIKLSRTEHNLRRRLKRSIALLRRVRMRIGGDSNLLGRGSNRVGGLSQAEKLLASIRQKAAFKNLKHGFIRRTLRLINQRLRQVKEGTPDDEGELKGKFERFESLFRRVRGKLSQGSRDWSAVRRADNKYRRALVASRSGNAELASKLIDDGLSILERLQGSFRAGNEKGMQYQDRAGGLAQSCNKAILEAEDLRKRAVTAASRKGITRALLKRADRLVSSARSNCESKNYRRAIQEAKLSHRLYQKAMEMAADASIE